MNLRLFLFLTSLYTVFAFCTYALDYGWWISLLGASLILAFGKFALGAGWRTHLGLAVPKRDLVFAVISFIALCLVFGVYIFYQVKTYELVFYWYWQLDVPFYHLHTLAQVFSEEIALGGIPLLWLARIINASSSQKTLLNQHGKVIVAAVLFAVIFSFLHFALYAWSPFIPKTSMQLSALSLFSLFCVGVIRNLLIVWRAHIAYALSLHLAWNVFFFGGMVFRGNSQVDEIELFNLILGKPQVALLLTLITAVILFVILRSPKLRIVSNQPKAL